MQILQTLSSLLRYDEYFYFRNSSRYLALKQSLYAFWLNKMVFQINICAKIIHALRTENASTGDLISPARATSATSGHTAIPNFQVIYMLLLLAVLILQQ